MNHTILTPGKYYVGDPCLAIPRDQWSNYLHHMRNSKPYRGARISAFHTPYDGTYTTTSGMVITVDSGIIALVPIEATSPEQMQKPAAMDNVVEFTNTARYDQDERHHCVRVATGLFNDGFRIHFCEGRCPWALEHNDFGQEEESEEEDWPGFDLKYQEEQAIN